MGIKVSWDNDDKSVLRYDMGEFWDWDDFSNIVHDALDMRHGVKHRVDVIINAPDGMRPPLGFPMALIIEHTLFASTAVKGAVVCVGNDHFRNTMTFICRNIADKERIARRVFVTNTMEQARAIIAQQRAGEIAVQQVLATKL